MKNQNDIFNELSTIFSQERLNAYLIHPKCHNSKTDALIAYSWNIELSQALYPALQIFEITLRNALHNSISALYKTENWFDLYFLHDKEKRLLNQAKENLIKQKKQIETNRVIAELSFGFWTSLFDLRYEHNQVLWPKLLKPTFPFLPKNQRTRTFLSRELNQIRLLRNRIFHYEPIWHWQDLPNKHHSITSLAKYLSPSASEYLNFFDQFQEIYSQGKIQRERTLNNPRRAIHFN